MIDKNRNKNPPIVQTIFDKPSSNSQASHKFSAHKIGIYLGLISIMSTENKLELNFFYKLLEYLLLQLYESVTLSIVCKRG